jgi:PAS domain S-box-containing protein
VALRKSEERYALAVLGANDGIWDRDLDTGEVYFSPRWKGMLNYEDHELPNHLNEWKSRIHSDDFGRVTNTLQWYLGGHIPVYEVEYRLRAKDGSYRWIHTRGACLRDPCGNPYRIAGSHGHYLSQREVAFGVERKYRKIFEDSRTLFCLWLMPDFDINLRPGALRYPTQELLDITRISMLMKGRKIFTAFHRRFCQDLQVEIKRADEKCMVHISAS